MVTGTCSYAACSLPGRHRDGEWLFCTRHVDEHEALMAADGELVKATDVQRFTPEARRKQIGQLIDRGLGTAEIAAEIGLTYHSVRIYRRELMRPQRAADGERPRPVGTPRLSKDVRRERVGRLLDEGLTTDQIAAQLGLTRQWVVGYRLNIGRPEPGPVAQCGTRAGRQRHRDRGETACPECVEADRAYFAERYRQRRKVAA